MLNALSVIHHLPCVGDSLVAKCLGSMQGVSLLSEVHPFASGGPANPLLQASRWMDINVQEEAANRGIEELNWLQAVELINECVSDRGERLLIRDWSHLDYIGAPWVSEPPFKLNTAEVLSSSFELTQAALVRHPIEQWAALSVQKAVGDKLDVQQFLKGYRAFAERAASLGFVRYEDFVLDPDASLQSLCSMLRLAFDDAYVDKWAEFTKITDNVCAGTDGSGALSTAIVSMDDSDRDERMLAEFRSCEDYMPSLELLGYSAQ